MCSFFQELSLFGCYKLTDASLMHIAPTLNDNIVSLTLARVGKLTDKSLVQILQNCTNLVELNLASCRKITGGYIGTNGCLIGRYFHVRIG